MPAGGVLALRSASATALLAALSALGCKSEAVPEPSPSSTAAVAPAHRLVVTEAPAEGAVDAIVRSALEQAAADKKRLLVYVGAAWCEPCQRFHGAAQRGELDAKFPDVVMLAFDLDRDRERLVAAGYVSKMIPLFALPADSGRSSGKQVEGSIKGDGAVANIAPRLEELLGN